MKQNFYLSLLFSWLFSLNLVAQSLPASFANKSIFKQEFPLTATFRGNNGTRPDYEKFLEGMIFAKTHVPDFMDVNSFFDTTNVVFLKRMADENPTKLFTQVQQGMAGVPRNLDPWPDKLDRLAAMAITFPGHWVFKVHTSITSDLSIGATTIKVADGSIFTRNNYWGDYPSGEPAVIVEIDNAGNKIWENFEYVFIRTIDVNTLTVNRAYRDSPGSRSFEAGKAVIAPVIAYKGWDKPEVWYANFSPNCPRDANGKTAAEVLVDDMALRFDDNGTLSNFKGIDFATGPFKDAPLDADYNFDGTTDSDQEFYDGIHSYIAKLRQRFGDDFVILNGTTDYRYVNDFNGLSKEGLIQPDDPWRNVGEMLNEDLFWGEYSVRPQVGIDVLRIQEGGEAGIDNVENWLNLTRMGYGFGTCIGHAVEVRDKMLNDFDKTIPEVLELSWVELYKGIEDVENWLGTPTSPLIRMAYLSPNLLGATKTDWESMIQKMTYDNGEMKIENGELVLIPDPSKVNHHVTLTVDLNQARDLTLLLELKADGNETTRAINNIGISPSNEVRTGPDSDVTFTNDQYLTRTMYWRLDANNYSSYTIDFNIKGEGSDAFTTRIKSLGIYQSPEAIARSFENGVVLVNPSLQDHTFDLNALFGPERSYKRLQAPNVTVPAFWQAQKDQTMAMNNGEVVDDPSNVIVPPLNALFLESSSLESDETKSIMIFPNPSAGIFIISSKNTLKEVVVYNLSGQPVYREDINNRDEHQINLSNLSSGIYFISSSDDKGITETYKVIVE